MNVIVSNEHQKELITFDVDVIKNITGEYSASELVEIFGNFFYDHMILDVTALKQYDDYKTYHVLTQGLDAEKLILWLPEGSNLCTPNFLARLISYGIYNFTTNLNGVMYLLNKPNTFKEVENIAKLSNINEQDRAEKQRLEREKMNPNNKQVIIGFRNVTPQAGSTTLIYMIQKELTAIYGQDKTMSIEINKGDFAFFYDKRMVSIRQQDLRATLQNMSAVNIILIDLNDYPDDSICTDVIYLIEPSTLKLNRLIRRNRQIFEGLANKKVVLNQSLLLNNDIFDFETESGIKIIYNLPPLDERKRNPVMLEFLSKLGLLDKDMKSKTAGTAGKIFGLFRR